MVVKYFDVAVQAIFKNWTALQLLITNVRFINDILSSYLMDNYQEDEEAEEDLTKLIINALFRKLEDGKQKLRQNGLNSL